MSAETRDFETRIEDLTELAERIDSAIHQRDTAFLNTINLAALEKQAGKLCDEITRAAPQTAREVQPAMGDLIQKLTDLEQHLEEFKAQIKAQY